MTGGLGVLWVCLPGRRRFLVVRSMRLRRESLACIAVVSPSGVVIRGLLEPVVSSR